MTPSTTPRGPGGGIRRSVPHRAAAVLVTLALALAGCGGGDDDEGSGGPEATEPGGDGSTTSTPADAGEVVASRLVVFTAGTDADPEGDGPGLVVDGTDVRAFRGRFLPDGSDGAEILDALADDLDDGDGEPGTVYVGGLVSVGCAGPDDTEVRLIDGDLRFVPVGFDPGTGQECDETVTSVALAAVSENDLPDDVTIAGEPADAPVGPGRVVVFERPSGRPSEDAEELRSEDATVDFLEDHDVVADLGEVDPDDRRFGFVMSGCAAGGAEIVIGDGEITVEPRDSGEQLCEAEERYVVVVDVAVSASGGLQPDI